MMLWDWIRLIFAVMCFSAIIAVGLWAAGLVPTNFGGTMLYSQAIGLSIFAMHALTALVPVPGSREVKMIIRMVFSVPIGYSLGIRVAAYLLGDDVVGMTLSELPRLELTITAIASICVFYFFWSRDRLHHAMAAHARAESLASEANLRLLRAQIEPHMLFNTLANLRSLVEVDSLRAQHMLDQLILFLRASLSASQTESRTLEAEFDQLRAYLELMKIRMERRLEYRLELPDGLRQARIPAMLLQPLAENAIKHGLEPAIDGGRIDIRAFDRGGVLEVEVIDTGGGLKESEHAGYGLAHIRERLRVLFGPRAGFEVATNPPHGVRATITLPLSMS
jgi:signal transduction histidine kinase